MVSGPLFGGYEATPGDYGADSNSVAYNIGDLLGTIGPMFFGGGEEAVAKEGESLATACRLSFDPKTPVLMAGGKTTPIGKIKPGEKVAAADPTTGKRVGNRTVLAVWINHDHDLLDLTIATPGHHKATIHTTANHPFWDDTVHAWVPAGQLIPGHALETAADTHAYVAGVHATPGAAHRWNLTVDQLHTYYVLAGSTPILVHNSGICGKTALENGDWQHILDRHRPGGTLSDDESGIFTGKEKVVRQRIIDTINRGTPKPNTQG
jgi:hypothetical protein